MAAAVTSPSSPVESPAKGPQARSSSASRRSASTARPNSVTPSASAAASAAASASAAATAASAPANRSQSTTDSLVTVSLSSSSDGDDDNDDDDNKNDNDKNDNDTNKTVRSSFSSDKTISVVAHPARKSSASPPSPSQSSAPSTPSTPSTPFSASSTPSSSKPDPPLDEQSTPTAPARSQSTETVGDMPSPEQIVSLVARLEEENARLASDPRSNPQCHNSSRLSATEENSSPSSPSLRQIGRLFHGQLPAGSRVSLLPERPLTELEFWSYLVRDFHSISTGLPSLTTSKLRTGVPPPLRGLVWASVAGVGVGTPAAAELSELWEALSTKDTPFASLIAKDIGRCFPTVDMFRQPSGHGQTMLRRVLSAFSLFDPDIGYCQGLGFLVGTLLMQMGESEAFSVLVRLMHHYGLRSFYLPDLAGLHLAIYQFQSLLRTHHPTLEEHLKSLKVDCTFLTQWFMSLFAATCPLPLLFRIYDILLFEGAQLTLLRVAMALIRRNEDTILAKSEFEDVTRFLISPKMWDVYDDSRVSVSSQSSATSRSGSVLSTVTTSGTRVSRTMGPRPSTPGCDALIHDITSLIPIVHPAVLAEIEVIFDNLPLHEKPGTEEYIQRNGMPPGIPTTSTLSSRFFNKIWGSNATTSPKMDSTPASNLKPAGSSSSSVFSVPSSDSTVTTVPSIAPTVVIVSDSDGQRSSASSDEDKIGSSKSSDFRVSSRSDRGDRSLHEQIESLLNALRHLQHEHSATIDDLRTEREARANDMACFHELAKSVQAQMSVDSRLHWQPISHGGPLNSDSRPDVSAPDSKSQLMSRFSIPMSFHYKPEHSRSRSTNAAAIPKSLQTALTEAMTRLKESAGSSAENTADPFEPPSVRVMRAALQAMSAREAAASNALAVRDAQIIRLTDQLAQQTIESERLRFRARDAGDRSRDWDRMIDELHEVRAERDRLLQSSAAAAAAAAAASSSPSVSNSTVKASSPHGLRQLRLGDIHTHLQQSQQVTPPRSPPPHLLYSPQVSSLSRSFSVASTTTSTASPQRHLSKRASSSSSTRSSIQLRSTSLSPSPSISKSTLQMQADLEAVLVELAKAKTAEASALQDLDEMTAKYDTLRRSVAQPVSSSSSGTNSNNNGNCMRKKDSGLQPFPLLSLNGSSSPGLGLGLSSPPSGSLPQSSSASSTSLSGTRSASTTISSLAPSSTTTTTASSSSSSTFGGFFASWRKGSTAASTAPPAVSSSASTGTSSATAGR